MDCDVYTYIAHKLSFDPSVNLNLGLNFFLSSSCGIFEEIVDLDEKVEVEAATS